MLLTHSYKCLWLISTSIFQATEEKNTIIEDLVLNILVKTHWLSKKTNKGCYTNNFRGHSQIDFETENVMVTFWGWEALYHNVNINQVNGTIS